MKRSFTSRPPIFGICSVLSLPSASVPTVHAQPRAHARLAATQREKGAIMRALHSELNHQTAGHVRVASFSVPLLDVEANYALAKVNPLKPADLDSVFVLMRKRRGQWKVVTLGTNMKGAGREHGVPRRLWAKWGL